MGIFTKAFENVLGKSQSTSDGFTPLIYGGQTPLENSYSSEKLLRMYRGWVFSCGDVIGDTMASLDRNVYWSDQRKDRLKKHEYLDLLDSQRIKYISIMLKLLGAVYIYKEKAGNRVIGLTMLHSPLVQEVITDFGKTSHYIYNDGANYYQFEKEDLIVIKTFNPIFHRKGTQVNNSGMTPLKAACVQVAMDISSVEFNNIFFKNGARPGTVLSHEKQIDEEIRNKYLRQFKSQFGGLENSFKTVFMDQGIKLENFSVNQKDMEFTEQRKFTMDEILMTFRVPKPLLGKSDGVGFADRGVPGFYFMEYNIKPLAKLIQDAMNMSLFEGKEYFEFGYVDKDELLKEYEKGVLSINEYRIATGKPAISGGDVLWDGTDASIPEVSPKKDVLKEGITKLFDNIHEKSIKKLVFGTEEYNEDIWVQKIKRTDKEEDKMRSIQRKIWKIQEEDILKALGNGKSVKEIKKEDEVLDEKKYQVMYGALYTKFFTDLMSSEGKIAMTEISDEVFAIAKLNKWIGKNIERMAKDIDKTTRKEIFGIIKQGNINGDGVATIKRAVTSKFDVYKKTGDKGRVDTIVRTEITDASNQAQEQAFIQSDVVESKQWYSSIDERRCPICSELHGKTIDLGGTFVKKGDKVAGVKLDYKTIKTPSAHPRCRCVVRPMISEKGKKSVENILKINGKSYGK